MYEVMHQPRDSWSSWLNLSEVPTTSGPVVIGDKLMQLSISYMLLFLNTTLFSGLFVASYDMECILELF